MIPALLFLSWRNLNSWHAYTITGFVFSLFGGIIGTGLFAFTDSGEPHTFLNFLNDCAIPLKDFRLARNFLFPALVYGTLTAIVYWLIVRPDRSLEMTTVSTSSDQIDITPRPD